MWLCLSSQWPYTGEPLYMKHSLTSLWPYTGHPNTCKSPLPLGGGDGLETVDAVNVRQVEQGGVGRLSLRRLLYHHLIQKHRLSKSTRGN